MRRCVIVGGAEIRDYPTIRQYLRSGDFFLFCDSGLRHMEGLNAAPDLIVGDFDSHANPHLPVETIVLPCEKDDTDTVFAMKTAVERGFCDFLLVGVIGGRLDHTLANVSALLWLHHQGKSALAVDDYSELEIVSKAAVQIPPRYPFFSLLNISGTAEGITIKNAKYPLENAAIQCDYQYGVSNEVLPGKIAEVSVAKGELLLIKDRI
ncbi:MAG: thiamine diphosphokinase [Faecousia sp.]